MESGGKENTLQNTLETLKSIRARETTVGEVDKKVCKLIEELETKSEEAVLKSLVRSEVTQHRDAQKWRKNAFFGLGVSILLLACVFGLSILSVTLAKEVYVSEASNERNPSMTNDQGEVLAAAAATRKWSLSMAPSLPDHLLKTITEITLKTPWNSTLSMEVVAREKTSFGIILETSDGTAIGVTLQGQAFLIQTGEMDSATPTVSEMAPELTSLMDGVFRKRGKRAMKIRKTCGQLKCASFSVKEDDELASKERRLQGGGHADSWTQCDNWLSGYQVGPDLHLNSATFECHAGSHTGQQYHHFGVVTWFDDGSGILTVKANAAECASRCTWFDGTDDGNEDIPSGTRRPDSTYASSSHQNVDWTCPELTDFRQGHSTSTAGANFAADTARAEQGEPTTERDTKYNDYFPSNNVCGSECEFYKANEYPYENDCTDDCIADFENHVRYCKPASLTTRQTCRSFTYKLATNQCCLSTAGMVDGSYRTGSDIVGFKD